MAAILASGLSENSRVIRKLRGERFSFSERMLGYIFDRVNWLRWAQTKDGARGRNIPEPIFNLLEKSRETAKKRDEIKTFSTAEEFENMRRRLIKGVNEWQKAKPE